MRSLVHGAVVAFAALVTAGALHPAVSAAGRGVPRTDAAGITWLCRPGLASNPCAAPLASTAVQADGSASTAPGAPVTSPAFDCFYVYPTVSREPAANADLAVETAETAVAVRQASRFAPLCRIWAPMYRQTTLTQLLKSGFPLPASSVDTAYASLLAGWREYIAHYNAGRPVVFIGHSQGSNLLMRLLSTEVETKPALLGRMVSAILPGGNVEVPVVSGGPGTFRHIPPCRSAGQTGCVIAYSSYPGQPPADSVFARPGKGASAGMKNQSAARTQVVCVNPAALGGGSAPLDSYFQAVDEPTPGVPVATDWVEYPGLYTATCRTDGDATWLDVEPGFPETDVRPLVKLGAPQMGLHSSDVNLVLGDLVRDLQAQEQAYASAARPRS